MFFLSLRFCMVEKTVDEIPKNRRVATIWPRERIHFPRTFFSYRNEIVHFFVFSSMAKFYFFLFSQKNKQTFLFTQENWWSFDVFIHKLFLFLSRSPPLISTEMNLIIEHSYLFATVIQSLTRSLAHFSFCQEYGEQSDSWKVSQTVLFYFILYYHYYFTVCAFVYT